jgi:hypothetical protein
MATEYFGTKAPKIPPTSYNQSIWLQTAYRNRVVGTGRWTSAGFLLIADSLVKKKNTLRSNFGLLQIRDKLLKEGILVDGDIVYYLLKKDILLSSPSGAARLVHGNDRDGLTDWKSSSGITLLKLIA